MTTAPHGIVRTEPFEARFQLRDRGRTIDLENPSKRGELIRAQLEIGHFLNARSVPSGSHFSWHRDWLLLLSGRSLGLSSNSLTLTFGASARVNCGHGKGFVAHGRRRDCPDSQKWHCRNGSALPNCPIRRLSPPVGVDSTQETLASSFRF
jgi:hypothetical protein